MQALLLIQILAYLSISFDQGILEGLQIASIGKLLFLLHQRFFRTRLTNARRRKCVVFLQRLSSCSILG